MNPEFGNRRILLENFAADISHGLDSGKKGSGRQMGEGRIPRFTEALLEIQHIFANKQLQEL